MSATEVLLPCSKVHPRYDCSRHARVRPSIRPRRGLRVGGLSPALWVVLKSEGGSSIEYPTKELQGLVGDHSGRCNIGDGDRSLCAVTVWSGNGGGA